MFKIIFYTTQAGETPMVDFLDSLNPKVLAKTLRSIDLLERFGPRLREPFSKAISDGIFELRTIYSQQLTRIFYFFQGRQQIILSNGFVKKANKTSRLALSLAKKYKKDYERRNSDDPL